MRMSRHPFPYPGHTDIFYISPSDRFLLHALGVVASALFGAAGLTQLVIYLNSVLENLYSRSKGVDL